VKTALAWQAMAAIFIIGNGDTVGRERERFDF
jgi:hypothetical protein